MLYKVETTSSRFHLIYVKAESIEDVLYKARKHFEAQDTIFARELHKMIVKIELVAKSIVE